MKPHEFLKDNENEKEINGTKIRKGSFGTLIENIRIITSSSSHSAEYTEALSDAKELYQTFKKSGLLEHIDVVCPKLKALLLTA